MINTKIYKAVYQLSEKLMEAANKDDRHTFDALYKELNTLCIEHEDTPKDHPEQWETLADFTEELADALVIYGTGRVNPRPTSRLNPPITHPLRGLTNSLSYQ